jgi:alkyl hydroperoxide reductase subunit F
MSQNTSKIYDLAIVGGGPAGAGAVVYAARKRLSTVFITKDWLGQSHVSEKIENWIGTPAISGMDLSKSLETHAKTYGKDMVDFQDGEICLSISKSGDVFEIKTDKDIYKSKTVLITSGSKRRTLDVKGAKEFEHKGLTYCATCDGPMYADMDVVVVGGGNAAFETASQLLAYCKSVTLLNRSDSFRADPVTVDAVSKHKNMRILKNAIPKEVKGDKFVKSIVYTDGSTGKDIEIATNGIFVEIGALPNTDFVKGIVNMDPVGHVMVDAKTQRTSVDGIWAAGDCTDGLYHQNNIAVGDAVKALEDIYLFIKLG